MYRTLLVFCCAFLVFQASAGADDSTEQKLRAAVNAEHRPAEYIARNQYRHPVETLMWFGIRDDMTVVEIWPGGGSWYTSILAPVLRENGKFYAANYPGDAKSRYYRENAQRYLSTIESNPEVYNKVVVTEFLPPDKAMAAPDNIADMVVTFRNLHNWVRGGFADEVFSAMFNALKPGGILGLVAHRGERHMVGKEFAETGYLAEEYAIQLAVEAGFELVDRSEINANPKDTKDYADGVWTLPPSYELGDENREKYAAIGESDRMTLTFRKPAN